MKISREIIELAALFRTAGIKDLKPNEKIKVYHGTRLSEVNKFVNGFDATKVVYRHYGGPRHAGLFVTPSIKLAASFGNELILEIVTRARNLHGTDYSGNIGRKQKSDMSWIEEKYPDSFRPYLTLSLLQTAEPQALLMGLVNPRQITRVRLKAPGQTQPVWYTRKEFLNLNLELEQGRKKVKVRDLGFDLSKPGYSAEEIIEMMVKLTGLQAQRVQKTVARRASNTKWLEEFLDHIGFGTIAIRSHVKTLQQKYK